MRSITGTDVHVEFPIYDAYSRSLKHRLGLGRIAKEFDRRATKRLNVGGAIDQSLSGRMVIKALDGVTFTFKEGQRVGLLGHNGSGKTTLLRTLAGIYEPTAGDILVEGRVTPLFDLQLGMDPDATGMENIWLRGKMLGLSNQQIDAALGDVAEFTELGDYLFVPIRSYSQGMMLRLAFGISTAIVPDILVLDEMIGAGDAAFIDRANDRLQEFISRAGILVVASHSFEVLRKWCNTGMLLERGKIIAQGPLEEVIAQYQGLSESRDRSTAQAPG